jgi:hypothetical protein
VTVSSASEGTFSVFLVDFLSPVWVGESLREVGYPVPGFEEFGRRADRCFARMQPEQFIWADMVANMPEKLGLYKMRRIWGGRVSVWQMEGRPLRPWW